MKQLKKTLVKQNLHRLKTPIEDTESRSPKYFNLTYVPQVLTAGKNVIKLAGNLSYLRRGSTIAVEILDFNGDIVYSEVLDYIESDGSRAIAIYIDDVTANGNALVTLCGFAAKTPQGVVIQPPTDIINVKHTFKIPVSNALRNSEDLVFIDEPDISIEEKIVSYLDVRRPNSALTSSVVFSEASYVNMGGTPILRLSGAGGNTLLKEHEFGTLQFASPSDPQPPPRPEFGSVYSTAYTASIIEILDNRTAILSSPYQVTDSETQTKTHAYKTFVSSSATLIYKDTGSYASTQNRYSYGLITIRDLEPSVGDVYKLKVYVKSNGTPASEYTMVYDDIVSSTELFIDTGSSELIREIGQIQNIDHINSYYQIESVGNAPSASFLFDSSNLFYSLTPFHTASLGSTAYHVITTKPQYNISFTEGALYTLQFDSRCVISAFSGNSSPFQLDVYVSGSGFNPTSKVYPEYGKKIGTITPQNNVPTRFINTQLDFIADREGGGVLKFHYTGGAWYLADISVRSKKKLGYTPNTINLVVPIPSIHVNDKLDFKFEFYNYQSNQATFVKTLLNQSFRGGNLYIGGDENILTGSLFVAGASGSGVEISGKSGSFIRSIGYDGFVSASQLGDGSGFLMWSGSVLPDSGDSYSGVGLELYASGAGHMRFRTNPAIFEVVADSFFVGNTGSQFISGANGNLVISSSDFYMDEGGNVTIGANATILGLVAANSIATPSGGPPFLSEITSDGYARFVSASIGGFEIGTDVISSSNQTLILSSSGQITGSGVLFTGGVIGGFQITNEAIASLNGNLILSASDGSIQAKKGFVSGSDVNIAAPSFFLGSAQNFISGSNGQIEIVADTATLSGSGVIVLASTFFIGQTSSAFISGANGNLVISSSDFYMDEGGNVTIGANTTILGALSASHIQVPSSGPFLAEITSDGYARFVSASIGGFEIGTDVISSSNGALILSSSGQITGSNVLFDGGKIGGFVLGSDILSSSNGNLVLSASGQITGSNVLFNGGKIGGFIVGSDIISSSNGNLILSASGQITGSSVLFNGGTIGGFIIDNESIRSLNSLLHLSSSGELTASRGRVGGFIIGNDIISSSNGNLILSASGEVTASSIRATGSYTGSFTGEFVNICNIIADCLNGDGIVSSSQQVLFHLLTTGVVSGSTQISQLGFILSQGSSVVSSSTQILDGLNGTGITSGSSQILTLLSGSNIISGSAQISASLSGSGIMSSSGQVTSSLGNTGIISSSAQLSSSLSGSGIFSGSVSSSASSSGFIGGLDSFNAFYGGAQITTTGYVDVAPSWNTANPSGHNWSWNTSTGELTFSKAGTYALSVVVYGTGAAGAGTFYVSVMKDTGGGYAQILEGTSYSATNATVSFPSHVLTVAANDKIKLQVKHTTNGFTLSGLGTYISAIRLT